VLQMQTIKPRVGRLKELAIELGHDFIRWKEEPSPLLSGEKRSYLRAIQDAIAGVDEASVVLARAIQRIEELNLPDFMT